jgi:hypothetical protein
LERIIRIVLLLVLSPLIISLPHLLRQINMIPCHIVTHQPAIVTWNQIGLRQASCKHVRNTDGGGRTVAGSQILYPRITFASVSQIRITAAMPRAPSTLSMNANMVHGFRNRSWDRCGKARRVGVCALTMMRRRFGSPSAI